MADSLPLPQHTTTTTDYTLRESPLPFCVDVICLGTHSTSAAAVYDDRQASTLGGAYNGKCCASYVVTVDGAPLVLFGAGNGVVREYIDVFGGLVKVVPDSPQGMATVTSPVTTMLPPFLFIPSNKSSVAAELPTLLSVERGKQLSLFGGVAPSDKHRDGDLDGDTPLSSSQSSASSSSADSGDEGEMDGRRGNSALPSKLHSQNTANTSSHRKPFLVTVISEKSIVGALEVHRLAEAREALAVTTRKKSGARDREVPVPLEANLCNFARLSLSSRAAVVQTALRHAPHPVSTDALVEGGYLTPVFRATLGANPVTSMFVRTSAPFVLTPQEVSAMGFNSAGSTSTLSDREWLLTCDEEGNFPVVGSVTDVLLISCVGVDGMSSVTAAGSTSCGMTLWHERVGTVSRNVRFNLNNQRVQSRIRRAKGRLARRQKKCAIKKAYLEDQLLDAVKSYASTAVQERLHASVTAQSVSSEVGGLLSDVVALRQRLAELAAEEEQLNAIDNGEIEKWTARHEVMLVPRRPLLTITGDAAFSENLLEELLLARPLPTDTEDDQEVFILPCHPDRDRDESSIHLVSLASDVPYSDYYPDSITDRFDNNATDMARLAAALQAAIRANAAPPPHDSDDASRVDVESEKRVIVGSPTSPLGMTIEEVRERLITKQGSPKELRMYRRLLLIGKDPLATSAPTEGSFFAGDAKVVGIVPGEVTTSIVKEHALRRASDTRDAMEWESADTPAPAAAGVAEKAPPSAQIHWTPHPISEGAGFVPAPSAPSSAAPSLKELIEWKEDRTSSRRRAKVGAGARISEKALYRWINMLARAQIATQVEEAGKRLTSFLPLKVYLGQWADGGSVEGLFPREEAQIGVFALSAGSFVPVAGKPILSDTMLAVRDLHCSNTAADETFLMRAPSYTDSSALWRGRAIEPADFDPGQPQRENYGIGSDRVNSTNHSTYASSPPPLATAVANLNSQRSTPDGVVLSPRATQPSPPHHHQLISQTKRVFFYSNEDLLRRPSMVVIPFLVDPVTEREYTPPPEDALGSASPPSSSPCSFALLRSKVGMALGFEDEVDRLFMVLEAPLDDSDIEGGLTSTDARRDGKLQRRATAVEVTSVTQLLPLSSVVVTRRRGLGFSVERLPYLLRSATERESRSSSLDGANGADAVDDAAPSTFPSRPLTLLPLSNGSLSEADAAEVEAGNAFTHHGTSPQRPQGVRSVGKEVGSVPPSSRFSIELHPIASSDTNPPN